MPILCWPIFNAVKSTVRTGAVVKHAHRARHIHRIGRARHIHRAGRAAGVAKTVTAHKAIVGWTCIAIGSLGALGGGMWGGGALGGAPIGQPVAIAGPGANGEIGIGGFGGGFSGGGFPMTPFLPVGPGLQPAIAGAVPGFELPGAGAEQQIAAVIPPMFLAAEMLSPTVEQPGPGSAPQPQQPTEQTPKPVPEPASAALLASAIAAFVIGRRK
jgi:hypothetical protein